MDNHLENAKVEAFISELKKLAKDFAIYSNMGVERCYDGLVKSVDTSKNTASVLSGETLFENIPNKSGETLSVDDAVRVKAISNTLVDAYIGTRLDAVHIPYDKNNLTSYYGTPKIEIGTYVGTGTCGVDNKNKLIFAGTPYVVFIHDGYWWYEGAFYCSYQNSGRATAIFSSDSRLLVSTNTCTWKDNSLEWYNSAVYDSNKTLSAPYVRLQLNASGVTYRYIALCL